MLQHFCLHIVILLLLIPSLFAKESKTVREKIDAIPMEDRQHMEDFFRLFLLKEGGIYVLLGDKPMAITHYRPSTSINIASCLAQKFHYENETLRKGWESWKKYAHLFPSSRFILEGRKYSDHSFEIVLINKAECVKTIETNLSIFKKQMTALNLLETYQKGNTSLFELLQKHHGLLGILLGFGKGNALLFQDREDREKKNPFSLKTSICNDLCAAFPDSKSRPDKLLYLPNFVVDPSPQETKSLRKKYLSQRHHISQAIDHKNFLSFILERYCEDSPVYNFQTSSR